MRQSKSTSQVVRDVAPTILAAAAAVLVADPASAKWTECSDWELVDEHCTDACSGQDDYIKTCRDCEMVPSLDEPNQFEPSCGDEYEGHEALSKVGVCRPSCGGGDCCDCVNSEGCASDPQPECTWRNLWCLLC